MGGFVILERFDKYFSVWSKFLGGGVLAECSMFSVVSNDSCFGVTHFMVLMAVHGCS